MTEQHQFQAEVGRLLDIVARSLYSEKRIFLRELIANASDACDKLRYEAIAKPELAPDGDFRVTLNIDKAARTVTVADNGVGMSRDELVRNLGSIAHSGTLAFAERLTGDDAKDRALIGQFGVGFYSAFMVADKVQVASRRAGEDAAWLWTSDGKTGFTVEPAVESPLLKAPERGVAVIVHLRQGEDEFLDADKLRAIVRDYADHVAIPVELASADGEPEKLNEASALWTRPKSEIEDKQYTEFYHHVGIAFDEPWRTIHYRAEGVIEYAALLFVPGARPFDLFRPERKHGVKLYVRRVFITDDCEGLLPAWLRFLRGVVDSPDLPLNLSREMLQNNPVLSKIRSGLVKRVLGELQKAADIDTDAGAADYAKFWDDFGPVLKEGLYEDDGHRDALFKLARFRTTRSEAAGARPISLETYIGRMAAGQQAIYFATGEDLAALKRSPQLEGFAARGLEVLLLTDPVDEFWVRSVLEHDGKPLKSVARGGDDLERIAAKSANDKGAADDAAKADIAPLLAAFKAALGDQVKDVRASRRLTDSAVCLVADDDAMTMNLERLLKQHGQIDGLSKRVLEINPEHKLVRRLNDMTGDKAAAQDLREAAHLLLDQARILEGEALPDPAAFARRMSLFVSRGLGG